MSRSCLAAIMLSGFVASASFAQSPTEVSPLAPDKTQSAAVPSPASTAPQLAPADSVGGFDPVAATDAYLGTLPAAARAKSDSYFEGGYWIYVWDFLVTVAVMLLLLQTGISRRIREAAERVTRSRWIHVFIYFALFTLLITILTLPWTLYTDFFREHQYDLSNQTFGAWAGDQAKGLAVTLVLGGLAVAGLYAVVRRLPKTWPVWGSLVAMLFLVVGVLIGPIYIVPLFNKVTRIDDPEVSKPILSMARSNDISVSDVFVVDASRQSKRVSANVSGIFGTERITLNDNLLNRTSLPEIKAVTGHEMGHYVLNHIYEFLAYTLIIVIAAFAFIQRGFEWARQRWGAKWGIRDIADPAGLPLVSLLMTIFFFLLTPVTNSITRTNEAEADMFGLNVAREPDGFARAALRLSEYRKMEPGPIEEMVFYDHPSGRTRIYKSMVWKAEQLRLDKAQQ
ncbi:MAG TPA: M48 family metallopeptidase [Gemmatimonadaceae bacterium]|nr:M48 family metallopeptidase [Gemmatimonadaceae bacterium]